MSLAIFNTNNKDLSLLQTSWAQVLNPVIENPLSQSILLPGIKLKNGTTVINHKLGRQMQGWMVADNNLNCQIWRSAPLNDLTLSLTCTADATVNLVVF